MSDDTQKVISIFQRHKRGDSLHFPLDTEDGEVVISPDSFHYVTLKSDLDGEHFQEDELQEMAQMKHYIIKMMEHHKDAAVRVNNYHVPGNRLEEFFLSLDKRPGTLLEVKQYIPDNMA